MIFLFTFQLEFNLHHSKHKCVISRKCYTKSHKKSEKYKGDDGANVAEKTSFVLHHKNLSTSDFNRSLHNESRTIPDRIEPSVSNDTVSSLPTSTTSIYSSISNSMDDSKTTLSLTVDSDESSDENLTTSDLANDGTHFVENTDTNNNINYTYTSPASDNIADGNIGPASHHSNDLNNEISNVNDNNNNTNDNHTTSTATYNRNSSSRFSFRQKVRNIFEVKNDETDGEGTGYETQRNSQSRKNIFRDPSNSNRDSLNRENDRDSIQAPYESANTNDLSSSSYDSSHYNTLMDAPITDSPFDNSATINKSNYSKENSKERKSLRFKFLSKLHL
ncbi:hypothetical protein TBLA_0A04930 [Henningerozyma blattae CBS 6284]|uniref:Uncharacterized protein n=1 Tax=Henningerozyma blattae (strain ATCC 34711 / CBS 6284 / DSM 70876 / NBRC 10599 / NRRL Y-10934 / UCD 77-7) TaxID=1071380 RepID=I2GVY4_HENB6|nr:hypothetical protein TBLA_0A04930 [Tetrapisispora blattae CBS 6284]CCH58286.1 hypothetical protein TBLA_0A04930 [Tetrapisispora blattae CBS 6284]